MHLTVDKAAMNTLQTLNRQDREIDVWNELTKKKDEEKMEQTIRQGIVSDSQVVNYLSTLKDAPKRIMDASDNLEAAEYNLKLHEINELEQTKDELKQAEIEIAFEVNQNPAFKNKEAREAAIIIRQKDHTDYITAKNRLLIAKRKKAELENTIGKNRNQMFYVRNLFQSYCACAEMIAGLCHEQETSEMVESMKNLASTLSQVKEETNHV